MATTKRKTLPTTFRNLLSAGDVPALKALFDRCRLDARDGIRGQTALGFADCPDELTRWLVAKGLHIDTPDSYGRTPLRCRAAWPRDITILIELGADVNAADRYGCTPLHAAVPQPHNMQTLIEHGADLEARNLYGLTPLAEALATCGSADVMQRAQAVRVLLDAGAKVPDGAADQVRHIGEYFEFNRETFDAGFLEDADEGLTALYSTFDVAPVSVRRLHTGTSRIKVAEGPWRPLFEDLHEYLVPATEPPRTVQGETIRLAGLISREPAAADGAAGCGAGLGALADTLVKHLSSGTLVANSGDLRALAATVAAGRGDQEAADRLCELTVDWVRANPDPIRLAQSPAAR